MLNSSLDSSMSAEKQALTPKQEQFCLIYWERGNAAATYREVYEADKMTAGSVYQAVNQLLRNPKITIRLDALRAAMRETTEVSLKDHLVDLQRLRDSALASGKFSAAITAESRRGDALGFYVKKVETGRPGEFDDLSDKDLDNEIRELNLKLGTAKVVLLDSKRKTKGKSASPRAANK